MNPLDDDPFATPGRPRHRLLERMCVIEAGDAVLDGLMQTGPGTPVLFVPHPGPGPYEMSAPVCAELVWTLARRGAHTLRFSPRGCGASSGERAVEFAPDAPVSEGALDALEADARAAYRVLRETCERPLCVVGLGLGAAVAAQLARAHPVRRLCLVAPDHRAMPDAPQGGGGTCIAAVSVPGYVHEPLPPGDFGAGSGLTALSTQVCLALNVSSDVASTDDLRLAE